MAPARRQTMLFSATMTEEVRKLVALSLKHPVRWAAVGGGAAAGWCRCMVIAAWSLLLACLRAGVQFLPGVGCCLLLFTAKLTADQLFWQPPRSLALPWRRLAADAAAAAPKELTQEIVRLKGGAAAQKEATLLALCRWGPGACFVFSTGMRQK